MSYYGRVADAKADAKSVCNYDNASDSTSPVLNGGSDPGGMGDKSATFKPKTYTLGKSETNIRREYK